MNYIGLDCHISTLEFAVVNEKGVRTTKQRVNTGVKEFMAFVKSVPKPRKIFIEEGPLAGWLLETCKAFGEELIVTDPKRNLWIGRAGQKNDPIDATKLAHLARGGYIKEIHHPVGRRRRFRELILSYHDTVKTQTRVKNKLKAKFRQNGIRCTGETVYSVKHREMWKDRLPRVFRDQEIQKSPRDRYCPCCNDISDRGGSPSICSQEETVDVCWPRSGQKIIWRKGVFKQSDPRV